MDALTTSERHDAVADAMAEVVTGVPGAMWRLHELVAPAVRPMLRGEAHRIGVRLDADDLDGVALDATLELATLAASWHPDGAAPWVWARRRILALVHGHVGILTRELVDPDLVVEPPAAAPVGEPLAVLQSMAGRHAGVGAFASHLTAVASERDAAIWLTVRMEQAAGNRSPAVTAGAYHHLSPAAVRKVVQRVTERLDVLPAAQAA